MIGGNRSGIDHGRRGLAAEPALSECEPVFLENKIDADVLPRPDARRHPRIGPPAEAT
jgi:hypothetical protein